MPLTGTLAAHLETREALLVLDNCEHLLDGCSDLATSLLCSCPRAKILATCGAVPSLHPLAGADTSSRLGRSLASRAGFTRTVRGLVLAGTRPAWPPRTAPGASP